MRAVKARLKENDPPFITEWRRRYDALLARIEAAGGIPVVIDYLAYARGEDHLPIDSLDVLAVQGRCRFEGREADARFQSPVVENPSWLTVLVQANHWATVTGQDADEVCLATVEFARYEAELPVYRFVTLTGWRRRYEAALEPRDAFRHGRMERET